MIEVKYTFPSEVELLAFLASKKVYEPATVEPKSFPPPAPAEGHAATVARKPGRPKKDPAQGDVKVVPHAAPVTPTLVQPLDVKNGDPLPESMVGNDIDDLIEKPEETVKAAAPEPKVYTDADLKAAMEEFAGKVGIDALRHKLISVTGKARRSDIPPEQYGALIDAMRADMSQPKEGA